MDQKLTIEGIIRGGVEIGLKNAVAIIVNTLLWALTCWIPYLNIGTTIGLVVGVVAKASKGETISMTEIFDASYRKYMGEFFLSAGLVSVGVSIGYMLFVIPGIVISIAWSQALLLTIDKTKNPIEAITISNKVTYGKKGTMFLAQLVFGIAFVIAAAILSLIPMLGGLLCFALMILASFVFVGINAYIYKTLCAEV